MAATTALAGVGLVGVTALALAKRKRRAARAQPPRVQKRRFGLSAGEPPAAGLKRIALAQIDLAIELLRGEPSGYPERAVHETRKALKRLRALLRLLEGELGRGRAERERELLAGLAKRLAGPRDAEVMAQTLAALIERQPRKLGRRRGVRELRTQLHRERADATAQALGDTLAAAEVADELGALRTRVARWELSERRSASKLVKPGLARSYRAGRSGYRRAGKRKADTRTLHRWRKHVKDLRYALEALDTGAKSQRRTAKLARRADTLGEVLGEEHDLAVLAERVRADRRLRRRKRSRKLLLRAIARRRARLRKRALRDGARLYERKPKRLLKRLAAPHVRA